MNLSKSLGDIGLIGYAVGFGLVHTQYWIYSIPLLFLVPFGLWRFMHIITGEKQ